MPAKNHTHLYVKYKRRSGPTIKDSWWRCGDRDCGHVVDYEMAKNKFSRCNDCGAVFTLTPEAMRRVKPKCIRCMNTKQAKVLQRAELLVSTLPGLQQTNKDGLTIPSSPGSDMDQSVIDEIMKEEEDLF